MKLAVISLAAAALLVGCGDDFGGGKGAPPAEQREATLGCLRDRGLEARGVDSNRIEVQGGPRVEFLGSNNAAENKQFSGGAQSAEQVENALLYVEGASEDMLDDLEDCVADAVS